MVEPNLVRPSSSGAFVIAAIAALALLVCGVMIVMPEQPSTSDCCATVGSVQAQVPISLLAVLAPPILVAWLFAISPAVSQGLYRRLQLPSQRILCLLC